MTVGILFLSRRSQKPRPYKRPGDDIRTIEVRYNVPEELSFNLGLSFDINALSSLSPEQRKALFDGVGKIQSTIREAEMQAVTPKAVEDYSV